MDKKELKQLLEQVADGTTKPEEAMLQIKTEPYKEMGFAKLDTHRGIRQGAAEVIYGAGKTPEQICRIAAEMVREREKTVLITRMSQEAADYVAKELDLHYDSFSKIGRVGEVPEPDGIGKIVVATGGTSDVGVAGMHRLMSHVDDIMSARVIIAIAGMEGALASVIGGMADCPVIAVPTSIGYGANFGGLSALLSMLNSCASGVSVVNIDNGFGAGYLASMINHMEGSRT